MGGFFTFIQSIVSNHDIEQRAAGLTSVKKWSLVAESFLPAVHTNADTARLQKLIEELSAKLERKQMRIVNEPSMSRKGVQFEGGEEAQAMTTSRTASPEMRLYKE